MTEQECEAWAQTEWGRVMLPNLYVQLFLEVFRHAGILGSLIRPEKQARDYLAEAFPKDPPEFHEWAARRWLSWLSGFRARHAQGDCTDEDGLTMALAAYRGVRLVDERDRRREA